MLSERELSLLYVLARDYAVGDGAIIDAGCFLGGSSAALLAGIRDRTEPWAGPPVASYDRFLIEEYTLDQYFAGAPNARVGASFRGRYDRNMEPFDAPHEVYDGDIVELGWHGGPIEVLFLDVLKSWRINDAVLHTFFPNVLPGRTVVVHQDYGWGQLPWLHITVELMRDSLRWLDAMPWGSHVFLVEREIPERLLEISVERDIPTEEKLVLLDRAIARGDGGSADMVTLSKAAMLGELDRGDDAHLLVDAVEARTDDPSVHLCIQHTRMHLPPWPPPR